MVATSVESSDDPIADLCLEISCDCYRGSLNDVMKRFILCAKQFDFSHIVRVGGDDPLIDPLCCKYLIDKFLFESADFLYASHRDGWPYGCAAELISVEALIRAHNATKESIYLEHTIPSLIIQIIFLYKVLPQKIYVGLICCFQLITGRFRSC